MNPVKVCNCEVCGAPKGQPCRTPYGAPRMMPHEQRRRLSRQVRKAGLQRERDVQ